MPKKRSLKNAFYTLSKTEHGYAITPPAAKGIVISGGGAKGLAYAGMFQAMQDRGLLKHLTHAGGASAGAMTSSFLAVGMSSENMLKIATQLDITKLLDSKGILSRAEGTRLRNVFELLYIFQIKQHLEQVPESQKRSTDYILLKQKIRTCEHVLNTEGITIKTIDDILQLANSNKGLAKIDAALSILPKRMKDHDGNYIETPRITFIDLKRLRSLLPEDKKHLIKHLSVVTTNQTKQIIETYNEENNGHASIAEKVQHSGAHPVLFKPSKNEWGDTIADGGIKNNMPTKALEKAGLQPEEILCAKAEADDKFVERLNRAKNHSIEAVSGFDNFIDSIIHDILGGRLFEGRTKVLNREKVFYHLGNMLYLNTGKITTTTTAPTVQQREQAIETAYQQTLEFIDSQTKTFDNALIAMLYLGLNNLDQTLLNEDKNHEFFKSAALAKQICLLQNAVVQELGIHENKGAENLIVDIEHILKEQSGLTELQQHQAMALCLKQINYFSEGKLENYIINKIKEEEGPKVSWFVQLLELLWKPIEWVLSLFSNDKPTETVETKVEENPSLKQDPSKFKPLRILSFLSYKEVTQINAPDKVMGEDEHDLKDGESFTPK